MKLQRKIKKTSRALWVVLLTGLCAPVWAIPASSSIMKYLNQYEIPKNFFTIFVVFSIPVYIGAFSDQLVQWVWTGLEDGLKKRGIIRRGKMMLCFCILAVTLLIGIPLALASVHNF
jgi:hypothetical protein